MANENTPIIPRYFSRNLKFFRAKAASSKSNIRVKLFVRGLFLHTSTKPSFKEESSVKKVKKKTK